MEPILNKLIQFDEELKMTFNLIETDMTECIVVSMIGCARVGKSTFINGFLTYMFGKNIDCVKTSNGSDHCTLGIDCICFSHNTQNIIVLDCQGLLYEDSKNDDK